MFVCKWGLAFCAFEGWVVFPFASLEVYAHATSSKSLLARKGVVEYAWIVWSDPEVLALCQI